MYPAAVVPFRCYIQGAPVVRNKTGVVPGQSRPSATPYEEDQRHWTSCRDKDSCSRCWFERGFRGELRKGGKPGAPDAAKAWCQKFMFRHPVSGADRTWLAVAPYNRPRFGVGCWVCAHYSPARWASSFSRLEVCTKDTLGPSAFQCHSRSKGHLDALAQMEADLRGSADSGAPTAVLDVPLLQRFHLAGTIVARHDSCTDFESYVKSLQVSAGNRSSGDLSRKVCMQMIFSMAEPLYRKDISILRKVTGLRFLLRLCLSFISPA